MNSRACTVIKLFFVHNKIITSFAVISTTIIMAYSVSVDKQEWWTGAGQLFEVFYQLSIGFLISFVFYILQVYMPSYINQGKAYIVIKNKLESLSYDSTRIVYVVETAVEIEDDIRLVFKKSECCYKRKIGNFTYFTRFEFTNEYIHEQKRIIDEKIKEITENSLYNQNSTEIMEIMANIQSNTFLSHFEKAILYKEANKSIVDTGLKLEFIKFKMLTICLWKLINDFPIEIISLSQEDMKRLEDFKHKG